MIRERLFSLGKTSVLLCAAMMMSLTFGSCKDDDESSKPKYRCHADIGGTVYDWEDPFFGKVLEDIRITPIFILEDGTEVVEQPVVTNGYGWYQFSGEALSDSVRLVAEDPAGRYYSVSCNLHLLPSDFFCATPAVAHGDVNCPIISRTFEFNMKRKDSASAHQDMFLLQGQVMSTDRDLLSGIRIAVSSLDENGGKVPTDTIYSQENGHYVGVGMLRTDSVRLVFDDLTGKYASDSIDIRLHVAEHFHDSETGTDGYRGEYNRVVELRLLNVDPQQGGTGQ